MANNELLDKVMKFIDHNEHLWVQGSWASLIRNGWDTDELYQFVVEDPQNPLCGTARCFAGHAVAFEGWLPIFGTFGETADRTTYDCQNKAGEKADISTKAREVLQIDYYTADLLFAGGNTIDQLRAMVAHIKEHGKLERGWDSKDVRCPDCEGTGEVLTACECCGQSVTEQCSECDGSGEITVDRDGDRVYA